jgi:hypothetical protein
LREEAYIQSDAQIVGMSSPDGKFVAGEFFGNGSNSSRRISVAFRNGKGEPAKMDVDILADGSCEIHEPMSMIIIKP